MVESESLSSSPYTTSAVPPEAWLERSGSAEPGSEARWLLSLRVESPRSPLGVRSRARAEEGVMGLDIELLRVSLSRVREARGVVNDTWSPVAEDAADADGFDVEDEGGDVDVAAPLPDAGDRARPPSRRKSALSRCRSLIALGGSGGPWRPKRSGLLSNEPGFDDAADEVPALPWPWP